MSRNHILLCGGFRLPDGSASAQRALPNAQLLASIGYEVTLVGKAHMPSLGGGPVEPHKFEAGGFPCYNILSPDDGKYPHYERSNAVLERVTDLVGRDRVLAIITYNYPMIGVRLMDKFCRQNGILPVVDTTEWYGLGGVRPMDVLRFLEHEYRMRVVQKKVSNLICGSSYLAEFYKGLNTVVVPNCVDMAAPKWAAEIPPREDKKRRFIFVGSPGARMRKENVGAIVTAFADLKRSGAEFVFHVVGINRQQLVEGYPGSVSDVRILGDSLVCHGRLPHAQALAELRNSDFFVFLRPNTRANQAGCPTKLAEAFSCGVPTIVNDTGDIRKYMTSPLHGTVIDQPESAPMAAALRAALEVPEDKLAEMKAACKRDNPFRYQIYEQPVREFFARAR
jgi:glycosyltransferase involved in cell wall biosynthesis